MKKQPNQSSGIRRTFHDLSEKEIAALDTAFLATRQGWGGRAGWDDLLLSPRGLIVSEAGSGKTYECRARRDLLWEAGEPAFFLDLATLAARPLREMLDGDEEARFDAWRASQSEVATFFLDSIDELKLSLRSLELALKKFSKALGGQLGRARIGLIPCFRKDARLALSNVCCSPKPRSEKMWFVRRCVPSLHGWHFTATISSKKSESENLRCFSTKGIHNRCVRLSAFRRSMPTSNALDRVVGEDCMFRKFRCIGSPTRDSGHPFCNTGDPGWKTRRSVSS
jgi:hypothetical protein